MSDDPRLGLTVTHRRYVPYSHAHYAGNLVDGAYSLGLFGDVATEVCIRTDGDEGLFASYSDVQFRAPVRAGDVLEVERRRHPGRAPITHARPRRSGDLPRPTRPRRVGAEVLESRSSRPPPPEPSSCRPAPDARRRVDPTRRNGINSGQTSRDNAAALTCMFGHIARWADALTGARGLLAGFRSPLSRLPGDIGVRAVRDSWFLIQTQPRLGGRKALCRSAEWTRKEPGPQ